MVLGGLVSLGVPVEYLQEQLDRLPTAAMRLQAEPVQRCGVSAIKVNVSAERGEHGLGYAELREIIVAADLSARVKEQSLAVLRRLAEAEAEVHGVKPDDVHFHELGGLDTLADIVGTCLGLEYLGVELCACSPLPFTRGFVHAEHGLLPVPAPATARIMEGLPVAHLDFEGEFVTPTGAALVATLCRSFGGPPAMTIEKVGHGAGSADRRIPNVLRLFLGTLEVEAEGLETDQVTVLETNVDDMSPELFAHCFDRLREAGALDYFVTPILMKKGRPAHLLTVLAPPEDTAAVSDVIFEETSTIGIRLRRQQRLCLRRQVLTVATHYGPIRIKVAFRARRAVHFAPEYEDCLAAAEEHKAPLKNVYAAALAAAEQLAQQGGLEPQP